MEVGSLATTPREDGASSNMRRAQAWNEHSIRLMEEGNLHEAALFLKKAAIALSESSKKIVWTEEQQVDAQDVDKPSVSIEAYGETQGKESHVFHRPFSFRVPSLEKPRGLSASLPSQHPKKKRKISSTSLDSSLSSSQHIRCSACCLFNAGLLFHLEWMSYTSKKSRSSALQENKENVEKAARTGDADELLIQACRCYEKAFRLVRRESLDRNEAVLHVIMAVCTNATECHLQLGNLDQAMIWNQQLCQLLAFSSFSISKIDFFLSSAFYNSFSRVAANSA